MRKRIKMHQRIDRSDYTLDGCLTVRGEILRSRQAKLSRDIHMIRKTSRHQSILLTYCSIALSSPGSFPPRCNRHQPSRTGDKWRTLGRLKRVILRPNCLRTPYGTKGISAPHPSNKKQTYARTTHNAPPSTLGSKYRLGKSNSPPTWRWCFDWTCPK